jgi:8-oxo-dGTP pyrophosphatase MutT (NUDIX family)
MSLQDKLHIYRSKHPSELVTVGACLKLLEEAPECFRRDAFPGHFTASAWTIARASRSTLLVHHAKLGKWVQPGGHADGEQNLFLAAKRELEEETGIEALPVLGGDIFDIDIHTIPSVGEEGTHKHYDVRFLFAVHERLPLRVSDESIDVNWVELNDLEQYTQEESILRMRRKSLHVITDDC